MSTRLITVANIGRDAVTKVVNGRTVINFPVARTERYKVGGQVKSKTLWIECSIWSEKLDLLPLLKKGQLCYVDGQPELKPFLDKPGAVLTLKVDKINILKATSFEELETNV